MIFNSVPLSALSEAFLKSSFGMARNMVVCKFQRSTYSMVFKYPCHESKKFEPTFSVFLFFRIFPCFFLSLFPSSFLSFFILFIFFLSAHFCQLCSHLVEFSFGGKDELQLGTNVINEKSYCPQQVVFRFVNC